MATIGVSVIKASFLVESAGDGNGGLGRRSTPGHDADDFQPVARGEGARAELRGRHGFAVMFDHHGARHETLGAEEFGEVARQDGGHPLAIAIPGAFN